MKISPKILFFGFALAENAPPFGNIKAQNSDNAKDENDYVSDYCRGGDEDIVDQPERRVADEYGTVDIGARLYLHDMIFEIVD